MKIMMFCGLFPLVAMASQPNCRIDEKEFDTYVVCDYAKYSKVPDLVFNMSYWIEPPVKFSVVSEKEIQLTEKTNTYSFKYEAGDWRLTSATYHEEIQNDFDGKTLYCTKTFDIKQSEASVEIVDNAIDGLTFMASESPQDCKLEYTVSRSLSDVIADLKDEELGSMMDDAKLRSKAVDSDEMVRYKSIIKANPVSDETLDSYMNLASILIKKTKMNEALVIVNALRDFAPDNAKVHELYEQIRLKN